MSQSVVSQSVVSQGVVSQSDVSQSLVSQSDVSQRVRIKLGTLGDDGSNLGIDPWSLRPWAKEGVPRPEAWKRGLSGGLKHGRGGWPGLSHGREGWLGLSHGREG